MSGPITQPPITVPPVTVPLGEATPHESARAHVTGQAMYTGDLPWKMDGVLHAWPLQAPHAHARITRLDTSGALAVPGVVRVLTAADVPGENDSGVKHDEPLFPSEVMYHGQAVCWVLAESLEQARKGAAQVKVEYEALPATLTLREAIAAGSFQGSASTMVRGDVSVAFAEAAHIFEGETECGGQEHFYLETHAALAQVDDAGQVFIQSSTQHPTETQEITAHVLGLPSHAVTVQCLRMGGGFGGKEMQPHGYAAVAALGAMLTGRPVSVVLNRQQDFSLTGKRHPYHATWKVAFSADGDLLGLQTTLTSDGGWSLDLSEPVLARAMCHVDNAYYIPHVEVHGRVAKTNKTSQTAFRGFGGPQGMLVIEDILGRCAPRLGLEPHELRRRNFYAPGQSTPYGQEVRHAERMPRLWADLLESSAFSERQEQIAEFNAQHPHARRGLAITPLKFGISFNFTSYNQAGALVHVYKDGSVLINHGGTEMGQGLHTKMIQVAAAALGVPPERVRLAPTRTDKVPNTSATAASSGADLNGGAILDACGQIKARLAEVAAGALLPLAREKVGALGLHPDDVRFDNGQVYPVGHPELGLDFRQVVHDAYHLRTPLWAAGYYRTPGLHWDRVAMQGHPFKYFAYGAAVAEVEVSGFTGEYLLRRVDILHDVGDSLSPLIDLGQVEGGFLQGVGWLTLEELRWDESDGPQRGRLLTGAAGTYKLPSLSELPEVLNVNFLREAHESGVVYGSKAVGEPPLMLALSVREALRQACAAFGPAGRETCLPSPATPEAVYWTLDEARRP